MTRKHDALMDDVLSDLDAGQGPETAREGARFLKRSTGLAERLSGEREEKTLQWVDPAACRMWERHNRDYKLLNEENCRDLIDGLKSQGQQEFPAIVRRLDGEEHAYEVICGARRHFAVSWLRANNYPQFKYLVEVRDLTDEEAFRLADIENRDRMDISDYERAIDYADAIERYYGGRQNRMAERLEVSAPWLSRYLQLAKLPNDIVMAFATIHDIKERHARDLKPLLEDTSLSLVLRARALELSVEQEKAKDGKRPFLDAATVMRLLKKACKDVEGKKPDNSLDYGPVTARPRGSKMILEFENSTSVEELREAFETFLDIRERVG